MRYTILVVDDEPAFCMILRRFLMSKGYRVVEAYDGANVVALYRREQPDLVLLDIHLPGKKGLEILQELRAVDPDASVIVVTAIPETELALKARKKGALEFLTKPIDPGYLELVIRTELPLVGSNGK